MAIGSTSERRADAEAAAWLARLHGSQAAGEVEAFRAWCADDPAHAAAFEHVTAAWDAAGGLRDLPRPTPKPALHRRAVMAGAVGGIAVAGTGLGFWQQAEANVYRTAVGEQRRLTLADGTHVMLDTNSEVRVRLGERTRHAALHRGRAGFVVARDRRPFEVEAADRRILANATALDVREDAGSVSVTLLEGTALVSGAEAGGTPIRLSTGQRLTSGPEATRMDHPDLEDTIAWQTGRAVFRGDTLTDAAAEMNRYSPVPLVVDPRVGALRISGTYRMGDNVAFAHSIATLLPVHASAAADHVSLTPAA